jgi:hypothetical protein
MVLQPRYWRTQLKRKAPRSTVRERKRPESEQGCGYGEQMDSAQMMAEWEPQRCVNTAVHGGLASAGWTLEA